VKTHPWLEDFPWDKLTDRSISPPFTPNQTEDNFDMKLHLNNDPWKDSNSEALQQSEVMLRQSSTQNLFAGYFYDEQQQNSLSDNVTHTK
jgi:serum/glucocorticoid-regulated kinase 2